MSNSLDSAAAAARRAQIEAALADYPHLCEERLADLTTWFRKEASALDVATLASNEAIADAYRRFRAEHIDPLSGKDMMWALIATVVVAALIALLVWRAL